MIIPDVNLLVYAHDATSRRHDAARDWWEALLNGTARVGLTWNAIPGFIIHPGDRHADILFDLLETAGAAGNLTADAHPAAMAIEHRAELHSADADMARFPGLRWKNPLG